MASRVGIGAQQASLGFIHLSLLFTLKLIYFKWKSNKLHYG